MAEVHNKLKKGKNMEQKETERELWSKIDGNAVVVEK